MNKPLVSVVVPTYNRGQPLVRTLKSLLKQQKVDFEILVVDQSKRRFAGKEKFLKEHPEIKYFKIFSPNAARAKNFGAMKARGEIILFVDDDIEARRGLIVNHVRNYVEARVVGVAGRVVTPGEKEELGRVGVGRVWPWGYVSGGFSSNLRQEVAGVYGCNASWRKEFFEKEGGFDERFVGNAIREETDLALRMSQWGEIIFDPKAEVVHKRAKSGGGRKDNRLKWYEDYFNNESVFMRKQVRRYWWWLFWLIRWQYFVRCMLGWGREISWRSLVTPFRGIRRGMKR
jgi:GT2 family glycosyltransferase